MSTATSNRDSSRGILLVGYSFRMRIELKEDNVPFALGDNAEVTAQLISSADTAFGAPATLDKDTPGSNWSQGRVVVVLPPTTTALVVSDDVRLHIVVVDGVHRWPWVIPVTVDRGLQA